MRFFVEVSHENDQARGRIYGAGRPGTESLARHIEGFRGIQTNVGVEVYSGLNGRRKLVRLSLAEADQLVDELTR